MAGPPFLRGDDVTLCAPDEDDLEFAQRLVNDPDVRAGIESFAPKTMDDERNWYESLGDDDTSLIIRADGERVGIIGHSEGVQSWGVAELGYSVAPEAWGNGYATDAVRQMTAYSFEERRYSKLVAQTYAHNEASQRVLEKAGFEQEAVHPKEAFVDGERVDIYRFGLLADDWRSGPGAGD